MKFKLRKKPLFVVVAFAVVALSGCATNGQFDVTNPLGTITKPPHTHEAIAATPITIFVPSDPNIRAGTGTQIVRDIRLEPWSVTAMPGAMYYRLFVENNSGNSLQVEARVDNGVVGSGLIYDVNYAVKQMRDGYEVVFTPVDKETYQQGLVGKFPVPNFTLDNLRTYLTSFKVYYEFDINSKYNPDSVYANFARLVQVQNFRAGERDPITNKIYKNWFISSVDGKKFRYVLQTYPYHNGTKAVIYASVPPIENSNGIYDYGTSIRDIRKQITTVANN
jgi:hypothetical protein